MKLIRALLAVLILLSIISKVSNVAYQKDMDVLITINKVEHQDPKFAIQEETRTKRDSIVINYAIGICTVAFLASFLFGNKLESIVTSERSK